jgi:hypothetical protein
MLSSIRASDLPPSFRVAIGNSIESNKVASALMADPAVQFVQTPSKQVTIVLLGPSTLSPYLDPTTILRHIGQLRVPGARVGRVELAPPRTLGASEWRSREQG